MAATIQRDTYFSFWNKYSNNADIKAMMLSHNADQLEQYDRADIIASLPDFTGKVVVDVGAGIGRFTSTFAERANHVVSSDFIESFIEKNKERNKNFNNITYQVNDALGLQLDPNSADLVFTNWLLMYLSEADVVQFLSNVMTWLKPGGNIHIRESCTESSSGKSHKGSMHTDQNSNPTHYRHASVYLQLLKEFRWVDDNGVMWKFNVLWAKSVPTYIERVFNWRQVHWLLVKVPAQQDGITDKNVLVNTMFQWNIVQDHTEFLLSNHMSWTDQVLRDAVSKMNLQEGNLPLLAFSPRVVSPFIYVNSHDIAEATSRNIWTVETNAHSYHHMLNVCMEKKDRRVQYGWNQDLKSVILDWSSKPKCFTGLVATELFLSNDSKTFAHLSDILLPKSEILSLEPAASLASFKENCQAVLPSDIQILDITEVSENCCEQKQAFDSPNQPCWLLVHALIH